MEAAENAMEATISHFEQAVESLRKRKVGNISEPQTALELLKQDVSIAYHSDSNGYTILHWACLANDIPIVTYLIEELGFDAENVRTKSGQTPLMWAVLREHLVLMNYLLRRSSTSAVNAADSTGASPILLAAQNSSIHALLLLAHSGADINSADNNGASLVHWAAFMGDVEGMQFLHYLGADFSQRDKQGMLPLHMAVLAEQPSSCLYLMAPPHVQSPLDKAQSEDQETPLQLARLRRSEENCVLALLEEQAGVVRSETPLPVDAPTSVGIQGLPLSTCLRRKHGVVKRFSLLTENVELFAPLTIIMICLVIFEWSSTIRGFIPGTTASKYYPTLTTFSCHLFDVTMAIVFLGYIYLVLKDPGRISHGKRPDTVVEEIQRALVQPVEDVEKLKNVLDLSRICKTCWIRKDYRTKHCSLCNRCVNNFDHHCVWIRNCVGCDNHRTFVVWLILVCIAESIYVFWSSYLVASSFLSYAKSNLSFRNSFTDHLFGSIGAVFVLPLHLPLVLTMALCVTVLLCWNLILLRTQLRDIARNMTTNESIMWFRYPHFSRTTPLSDTENSKSVTGGVSQFHNPFDRGALRNCIQFWSGNRCAAFARPVVSSLAAKSTEASTTSTEMTEFFRKP